MIDQAVIGKRLLDPQPRKERHQKQHCHNRDVVGRRHDFPKLMPVLNGINKKAKQHDGNSQADQLVPSRTGLWLDYRAHFFFGTFISDSSITGAGPDMPPSFRMRQKCTAIKTDATSGMPMQCQMYARSKAFASTIDPPSKPKRTSLYGVRPRFAPKGPSFPSMGVARAMFVPTVTAQKPS